MRAAFSPDPLERASTDSSAGRAAAKMRALLRARPAARLRRGEAVPV